MKGRLLQRRGGVAKVSAAVGEGGNGRVIEVGCRVCLCKGKSEKLM